MASTKKSCSHLADIQACPEEQDDHVFADQPAFSGTCICNFADMQAGPEEH